MDGFVISSAADRFLFLSPNYFHSPYAILLTTVVYNPLHSSTVLKYSYVLARNLVSDAHESTSLRQVDRSKLSTCGITMERVLIQHFELSERLELNYKIWLLPIFFRSSTVCFSVLTSIIPATYPDLFPFVYTDLIQCSVNRTCGR